MQDTCPKPHRSDFAKGGGPRAILGAPCKTHRRANTKTVDARDDEIFNALNERARGNAELRQLEGISKL